MSSAFALCRGKNCNKKWEYKISAVIFNLLWTTSWASLHFGIICLVAISWVEASRGFSVTSRQMDMFPSPPHRRMLSFKASNFLHFLFAKMLKKLFSHAMGLWDLRNERTCAMHFFTFYAREEKKNVSNVSALFHLRWRTLHSGPFFNRTKVSLTSLTGYAKKNITAQLWGRKKNCGKVHKNALQATMQYAWHYLEGQVHGIFHAIMATPLIK